MSLPVEVLPKGWTESQFGNSPVVGVVVLIALATGAQAKAPELDFNSGGVVNILETPLAASCIGQGRSLETNCANVVSDGDGNADVYDIDFVVASYGETGFPINTPSVADEDTHRAVFFNDTVVLDGSGSSDTHGDGLKFRWTTIMGRPHNKRIAIGESHSLTHNSDSIRVVAACTKYCATAPPKQNTQQWISARSAVGRIWPGS